MRIGIDLGGPKIKVNTLTSDGKIAVRWGVAIPTGNYDKTVRAV